MAILDGTVSIEETIDAATVAGEKWSVTVAGVTTEIDPLAVGRKGTGYIKISFVEDDA